MFRPDRWLAAVCLFSLLPGFPISSAPLPIEGPAVRGAVGRDEAVEIDTLRLRNGREYSGRLRRADDETITFETEGEQRTYTRDQVAAVILAEEESAGGLPPGISLAPGLTAERWITIRRITKFKYADGMAIYGLRMSGNGRRIAFCGLKGTFVIDADGGNMKQLASARNDGLLDISADGRRVVWADKEGLFSANSDGSGKVKLPVSGSISELCLNSRGGQVFVINQSAGALYRVAADGSDAKRVVTTAQACAILGVRTNNNHWRRNGLRASEDGSRIVFNFLYDQFGVNGDGSGLKRFSRFGNDSSGVSRGTISPNGAKVAYWNRYSSKTKKRYNVIIMDWDGGHRVEYNDINAEQSLDFTRDGSKVAATWGLAILGSDGQSKLSAIHLGGNYDLPNYRAHLGSISYDGRRVCLIVEAPSDANRHAQNLTIVDFNPPSLGGLPGLEQIDIQPRLAFNDGSNAFQTTLRPRVSEMGAARLVVMRNGWRDFRFTYYDGNVLRDDGKGGDKQAEDGLWSSENLRLYKDGGKVATPGPLTVRVWVSDKDHNATIVDVGGLQAKAP